MTYLDFYPEIEPYWQHMLEVGNGHQVYVEQCGNPEGEPLLFVHGGPGAGCSVNDRRFFDPDFFRIILFDQRGCGRSLPHGELAHNTTADLLADIEKIRRLLGIKQWHVFGGSWGSTLSLLYAQSQPDRVLSLVLRGIFLARDEDVNWTFAGGGASRVFSDGWQQFLTAAGFTRKNYSIDACYHILMGEDQERAKALARAWSYWEISSCTLLPNPDMVAAKLDDNTCWTLARHEAHFMYHQCFLTPNQILAKCASISHIPVTIVHGRYDMVCPFDNAWLLHQKLPQSSLVVSQSAGHSSSEPETRHHLITACNRIACADTTGNH